MFCSRRNCWQWQQRWREYTRTRSWTSNCTQRGRFKWSRYCKCPATIRGETFWFREGHTKLEELIYPKPSADAKMIIQEDFHSPCSFLKGKAWRLPIINLYYLLWLIMSCVWLYAQRLHACADLTFVCLKVFPHQTANKNLFLTPGRLAVGDILMGNFLKVGRQYIACSYKLQCCQVFSL